MTRHEGRVWFEQQPVANLRADGRGLLHITYTAGWIEAGFPISIRLPLSLGTRETNAHAFFAGLLPEGRARERIARQLKLRSDDDAGLLFAIGRDCAGALAILPGHEPPEPQKTHKPEHLTNEELNRIIDSRGAFALATNPGQRFSLAGAQDKLAVIYDDDRFLRPATRRTAGSGHRPPTRRAALQLPHRQLRRPREEPHPPYDVLRGRGRKT